MKSRVVKVDDNFVKVAIEDGKCPLNWLAEYYRDEECQGKLVMLDDRELLWLLNNAKCDSIDWEKGEEENTFTLRWKASEEFPETVVTIVSRGKATFFELEDGKLDVVPRNMNWNMIEVLEAADIIDEGIKYAERMTSDKQKVFVVADEPENESELEG